MVSDSKKSSGNLRGNTVWPGSYEQYKTVMGFVPQDDIVHEASHAFGPAFGAFGSRPGGELSMRDTMVWLYGG